MVPYTPCKGDNTRVMADPSLDRQTLSDVEVDEISGLIMENVEINAGFWIFFVH
jgi:hypothetical protein